MNNHENEANQYIIKGLGRLELCKKLLGLSHIKHEGPVACQQDMGRKHKCSLPVKICWSCHLEVLIGEKEHWGLGLLLNEMVTVMGGNEIYAPFWP